MNYFKSILIVALMSIGITYAQTNVKLKINHMQGSNAFALNQKSSTSFPEDYNAKRVEYYMTQLSLEHDGGVVTKIDSLWILVDVNGNSTFDLGQFNITSLEAIGFFIGVEPSFNHGDPTVWPVGHPLAPKSPSMHWGWTSGYRFFAMEGKCGSSMSAVYEYHSLGDNYYYEQRILTAGADDNGDLLITLNADYDKVFENIELGTGKIEHGDFPSNVQFLENVRDYVFTSLEGNGNSLSTVGIGNQTVSVDVSVYPSPSVDGIITIKTESTELSNSELVVYNQVGKVIYSEIIDDWNGSKTIEIREGGYYFLSIVKNNQELVHESIVVVK